MMQPIDKAREMILLFKYRCLECDTFDNAKESSKICCDYLINETRQESDNEFAPIYWEEVKKAIDTYKDEESLYCA